ncbi:MaoC/PaaZ C-terminal domain-containing protein [Blastococcus sp. Marseille-P5729]|uniref:MaoC/PaaZ C-terminal domain-containing protein n=1 Tax=Blastococcus sp. Marseille-P5729 TaxID=2086582 RepID=UPI000D105BB6|nr:MaoC/PaaZ C-terminal domain-containing protein [Blastococcus sp. Marseille-P5729]
MTMEVKVGDRLPSLRKTPDRETLVKYAAGGGDFNPLHFDADFPQVKQIGNNIVHGRLKYAAMGECVSNWLAHRGWIRSISAQYKGMDMVGATFTCQGEVVTVSEEPSQSGEPATVVTVKIWTEGADGAQTTNGEAAVVLTR